MRHISASHLIASPQRASESKTVPGTPSALPSRYLFFHEISKLVCVELRFCDLMLISLLGLLALDAYVPPTMPSCWLRTTPAVPCATLFDDLDDNVAVDSFNSHQDCPRCRGGQAPQWCHDRPGRRRVCRAQRSGPQQNISTREVRY